MSILHYEGFEQFTTLANLQKTYGAANAQHSIVSAGSAFGRGKFVRLDAGGAQELRKTIPARPLNSVIGQGVRVRLNSYPASWDRRELLVFYEGTSRHGSVFVETDGTLVLYCANVYRQRSIKVLLLNNWYHVEAKFRCDDTNGYFEVRVDGETVLYWEGDTRQGLTGVIDTVATARNNSTSGGQTDFDDWFVWDGQGDENNDWLGDCEVQTSLPTADDVTTGWTPNTGAAWDALNDDGEDGDTTYIASSELGAPASFAVADLATTPSKILAVQAFVTARKDDSGNRSIRFGIDSNGEVAESADQPLGLNYTGYSAVFEKNPDGDVAWTPAAVNALKARVQVTV
jgi:hypothetical protein